MLGTLSEVKARLSIGSGDTDSDGVLNTIMAGVDKSIKTYIDRGIEEAEYDHFIITEGDTRTFLLREWPISDEDSDDPTLEWDENELVEGDDFEIDYETGILVLGFTPTASMKKLHITYTAGYSTVPSDLNLVFLDMVCAMYQNRSGSSVRSESLGDYSVSFSDALRTAQGMISSHAFILDSYKRDA